MPDILIRGMEMPENCDKCIYSGWSNFYQIYVCNAVRKEEPILFDRKQVKSTAVARSGRADNCHLHELPEHGNLIDREDVIETIERLRDKSGNDEMAFALNWALRLIREKPVIIPSNKEDS